MVRSEDILNHKRTKRRTIARWLWIGGGTLVLLLCISFVYVVLRTDVLRVREISVSGDRFVTHEQVIQMLTAEIIAKHRSLVLLGPENILFWYFGRDANMTAPAEAIVSGVSMHVGIFERTVAIVVTERKLKGIWCTASGTCFAFDGDGIVFSSAPQTSGSLLVKIVDENIVEPRIGGPVLPDSVWVQNILRTLDTLSTHGIPVTQVTMRDLSLREWQATVYENVPVYFSLSFVPDNFDAVLNDLTARVDFTKLSYLDFRVKGRLYYK